MLILKRRFLLLFIALISIISCRNNDNNKTSSSDVVNTVDSDKTDVHRMKNSSGERKSVDEIGLPPVDTGGNAAKAEAMMKVDIKIKTFRNAESTGYGYEIIMDGHTYIHQPNIPAMPGNDGFSSEEKARKVAEFVSFKIKHNIMPPTVSVKELDSLGVR